MFYILNKFFGIFCTLNSVDSNWLSGDSNFARYLDGWKDAVPILGRIGLSGSWSMVSL